MCEYAQVEVLSDAASPASSQYVVEKHALSACMSDCGHEALPSFYLLSSSLARAPCMGEATCWPAATSNAHGSCFVTGVVPSATMQSKDGTYVIIGGNGDSVYSRLMAAVGRPDMGSSNPLYATNTLRCQRADEIYKVSGTACACCSAAVLLTLAQTHTRPVHVLLCTCSRKSHSQQMLCCAAARRATMNHAE